MKLIKRTLTISEWLSEQSPVDHWVTNDEINAAGKALDELLGIDRTKPQPKDPPFEYAKTKATKAQIRKRRLTYYKERRRRERAKRKYKLDQIQLQCWLECPFPNQSQSADRPRVKVRMRLADEPLELKPFDPEIHTFEISPDIWTSQPST